jgi:hypothetical protein
MSAGTLWLWLAPSARACAAAVELLQKHEIAHRVLLQRGDSAWFVLQCDAGEVAVLHDHGLRPLVPLVPP